MHILTILIFLVLVYEPTAVSSQIALDLDPRPGYQGVQEIKAKPGESKNVEVFALKDARDIQGFELELKFDYTKVKVKAFNPGGLMAGAMALPVQIQPDGAKVSCGFLGGKSAGDGARLGMLIIELGRDFGTDAKVDLVRGAYGAKGKSRKFLLQNSVRFVNQGYTPGAEQRPTPPSPVPRRIDQKKTRVDGTGAKMLVIKGTPVARISADGDECIRKVLRSGQQHGFTLLITKANGKYVWESREQRELVILESGAFTQLISPGNGWIKIGHSMRLLEVLNTAKAAGISDEGLSQLIGQNYLSDWMLEHKYFYFEFITQGMFIGVYWGFADEFSL